MADIVVQSCPQCKAEIDVSDFEPLNQIECPNCGAQMSVRGFIDHFRLIDMAGKGGMGVVYRGVDTKLDRRVALKLLRRDHSANQELISKLETEAAITGSINHPHVIRVYSTGFDHGRFFIAMELADKGSLDNLIQTQGRVAEIQVLSIGIQIAQGLRAAHQHGLIHRDVKPGNILFSEAHTAKIVDFGLAIFMHQEEDARGEIWGTPFYVAPEKLDGQPEDFRSDIYSLGATLFHALAGRPPFDAETPTLVALKHLKSQAVSIQAFAPWVSGSTAYVINRTLLKDPNDRYQTYEELIQHLEYSRDELQRKTATNPTARPNRIELENESTRKAMSWMTFAMLAAIVLVAIGAFVFRGNLFPSNQGPVVEVTKPELATPKTAEAFNQAVSQLASGKFARAADSFRAIATKNPAQPDLNWASIGEGIAELAAGNLEKSEGVFAHISERGLFSSDPESAALATFFFEFSRRMSTNEPIDPKIGSGLDLTNHEALALLAYGLKNRELVNMDWANQFLRRFRQSNPADEVAWIGELKPIANQFVEDYTRFQMVLQRYRNATQPKEKVAAAEELKQFPGSFGAYGSSLTESLAADLAAIAEGRQITTPAPVNPETSQNFAATLPENGEICKIVNRNSAKAIDCPVNIVEDGTGLQQHHNKGRPNQQFVFMDLGDGTYRIVSVSSQRAMQIEGDSARESAPIVVYQPSDAPSQKWKLVPSDDGYFNIINNATHKALAVGRNSKDAGAKLVQSTERAGLEQQWQLVTLSRSKEGKSAPKSKKEISSNPPPEPNFKPSTPSPAPTAAPTANQELEGWASQDIGAVTTPGTESRNPATGMMSISSRSDNIWDVEDSFRFVHKKVSGDFDASVRIGAVEAVDDFSKGGIMLRKTLEPNSANSCIVINAAKGIAFQNRASAGAKTISVKVPDILAPRFVKLSRRGTTVNGYYSDDGANWVLVSTTVMNDLPREVYVGLSVTSRNPNKTCTATFDHVNFPHAGGTLSAAPSDRKSH